MSLSSSSSLPRFSGNYQQSTDRNQQEYHQSQPGNHSDVAEARHVVHNLSPATSPPYDAPSHSYLHRPADVSEQQNMAQNEHNAPPREEVRVNEVSEPPLLRAVGAADPSNSDPVAKQRLPQTVAPPSPPPLRMASSSSSSQRKPNAAVSRSGGATTTTPAITGRQSRGLSATMTSIRRVDSSHTDDVIMPGFHFLPAFLHMAAALSRQMGSSPMRTLQFLIAPHQQQPQPSPSCPLKMHLSTLPVSTLFERPVELYIGVFILCSNGSMDEPAMAMVGPAAHNHSIITSLRDSNSGSGESSSMGKGGETMTADHVCGACYQASQRYVIVTVRTDAVFITDLGPFSLADAVRDLSGPSAAITAAAGPASSSVPSNAKNRLIAAICTGTWRGEVVTPSHIGQWVAHHQTDHQQQRTAIGAAARRHCALLETLRAAAYTGAPISHIIPVAQIGSVEAIKLGSSSSSAPSLVRLRLVGAQGEQSSQEYTLCDAVFPTGPSVPVTSQRHEFVSHFSSIDLAMAVGRAGALAQPTSQRAPTIKEAQLPTSFLDGASYYCRVEQISRVAIAELVAFFTNQSIPITNGSGATASVILSCLANTNDDSTTTVVDDMRVNASSGSTTAAQGGNDETNSRGFQQQGRSHTSVVFRSMSVAEQFEARTRALLGADTDNSTGSSTADGRGHVYANVNSALKLRKQLLLDDASRGFAREQARARFELRALQDYEVTAWGNERDFRIPAAATLKGPLSVASSSNSAARSHHGSEQSNNTSISEEITVQKEEDNELDDNDELLVGGNDGLIWSAVEAARHILQELLAKSLYQFQNEEAAHPPPSVTPAVQERSIVQWDVIGAASSPARIPNSVREHLFPSLLTSIPMLRAVSNGNSTTTPGHSSSQSATPRHSYTVANNGSLGASPQQQMFNSSLGSFAIPATSASSPRLPLDSTTTLNDNNNKKPFLQLNQREGRNHSVQAAVVLRSPFRDELVVMAGAVLVHATSTPEAVACPTRLGAPSTGCPAAATQPGGLFSSFASQQSSVARPPTPPSRPRGTLKNRLGLRTAMTQDSRSSATNLSIVSQTAALQQSLGSCPLSSISSPPQIDVASSIVQQSAKMLRVAICTTTHFNICSLSAYPFMVTSESGERSLPYRWGPSVVTSIPIPTIQRIIVFRREPPNSSTSPGTSSNVLNCLEIIYSCHNTIRHHQGNSDDVRGYTEEHEQQATIVLELPDPSPKGSRGGRHNTTKGAINHHRIAQRRSVETLRQQLLAEANPSPNTPTSCEKQTTRNRRTNRCDPLEERPGVHDSKNSDGGGQCSGGLRFSSSSLTPTTSSVEGDETDSFDSSSTTVVVPTTEYLDEDGETDPHSSGVASLSNTFVVPPDGSFASLMDDRKSGSNASFSSPTLNYATQHPSSHNSRSRGDPLGSSQHFAANADSSQRFRDAHLSRLSSSSGSHKGAGIGSNNASLVADFLVKLGERHGVKIRVSVRRDTSFSITGAMTLLTQPGEHNTQLGSPSAAPLTAQSLFSSRASEILNAVAAKSGMQRNSNHREGGGSTPPPTEAAPPAPSKKALLQRRIAESQEHALQMRKRLEEKARQKERLRALLSAKRDRREARRNAKHIAEYQKIVSSVGVPVNGEQQPLSSLLAEEALPSPLSPTAAPITQRQQQHSSSGKKRAGASLRHQRRFSQLIRRRLLQLDFTRDERGVSGVDLGDAILSLSTAAVEGDTVQYQLAVKCAAAANAPASPLCRLSIPLFGKLPAGLQHYMALLSSVRPPPRRAAAHPVAAPSVTQLAVLESPPPLPEPLEECVEPHQPLHELDDEWTVIDGTDKTDETEDCDAAATAQVSPAISDELLSARALLELAKPTLQWDTDAIRSALKRLIQLRAEAVKAAEKNGLLTIVTNDANEAARIKSRILSEAYRQGESAALDSGRKFNLRRNGRTLSTADRRGCNAQRSQHTTVKDTLVVVPVIATPTSEVFCVRDYRNPSPAILLRYLKGVRRSANNILLARCVLRFTSRRTWVPRVIMLMQTTVERVGGDGLVDGDDLSGDGCASVSLLVLDDNGMVHREIPANKICSLQLQRHHTTDSGHNTAADDSIYSFSVQGELVLIVRNDPKRGAFGEVAHGITHRQLGINPEANNNDRSNLSSVPPPLPGVPFDPLVSYFRYVLGATTEHFGTRYSTLSVGDALPSPPAVAAAGRKNFEQEDRASLPHEDSSTLTNWVCANNLLQGDVAGVTPTIKDFFSVLRSRYRYITYEETDDSPKENGAGDGSPTSAPSSSSPKTSMISKLFSNVASYVSLTPNHITTKTKAALKAQWRADHEAAVDASIKLEREIISARSQLHAWLREKQLEIANVEQSARSTIEVNEIFSRRAAAGPFQRVVMGALRSSKNREGQAGRRVSLLLGDDAEDLQLTEDASPATSKQVDNENTAPSAGVGVPGDPAVDPAALDNVSFQTVPSFADVARQASSLLFTKTPIIREATEEPIAILNLGPAATGAEHDMGRQEKSGPLHISDDGVSIPSVNQQGTPPHVGMMASQQSASLSEHIVVSPPEDDDEVDCSTNGAIEQLPQQPQQQRSESTLLSASGSLTARPGPYTTSPASFDTPATRTPLVRSSTEEPITTTNGQDTSNPASIDFPQFLLPSASQNEGPGQSSTNIVPDIFVRQDSHPDDTPLSFNNEMMVDIPPLTKRPSEGDYNSEGTTITPNHTTPQATEVNIDRNPNNEAIHDGIESGSVPTTNKEEGGPADSAHVDIVVCHEDPNLTQETDSSVCEATKPTDHSTTIVQLDEAAARFDLSLVADLFWVQLDENVSRMRFLIEEEQEARRICGDLEAHQRRIISTLELALFVSHQAEAIIAEECIMRTLQVNRAINALQALCYSSELESLVRRESLARVDIESGSCVLLSGMLQECNQQALAILPTNDFQTTVDCLKNEELRSRVEVETVCRVAYVLLDERIARELIAIEYTAECLVSHLRVAEEICRQALLVNESLTFATHCLRSTSEIEQSIRSHLEATSLFAVAAFFNVCAGRLAFFGAEEAEHNAVKLQQETEWASIQSHFTEGMALWLSSAMRLLEMEESLCRIKHEEETMRSLVEGEWNAFFIKDYSNLVGLLCSNIFANETSQRSTIARVEGEERRMVIDWGRRSMRTISHREKEGAQRSQIQDDEDSERDAIWIHAVVEKRHLNQRLNLQTEEEEARRATEYALLAKRNGILAEQTYFSMLGTANLLLSQSAAELFGARIGHLHTPAISLSHLSAFDNLSMFFPPSTAHHDRAATAASSSSILLDSPMSGPLRNEPSDLQSEDREGSDFVSADWNWMDAAEFSQAITCCANNDLCTKQLQSLHLLETCSALQIRDRPEIELWAETDRQVLINEYFIPLRKRILSLVAERMFVQDEEEDTRRAIEAEEARAWGTEPAETSMALHLSAAADDPAGGLPIDRVLKVLVSRQRFSGAASAFSTGLIRRVTNAVSLKRGGFCLLTFCGPLTSSSERRKASAADKAGTVSCQDVKRMILLQHRRQQLIVALLKEHDEEVFASEVESRRAILGIESQQRVGKLIQFLSGDFIRDSKLLIASTESSLRTALNTAFAKGVESVRAEEIRKLRRHHVTKPLKVDTTFSTQASMKRVAGGTTGKAPVRAVRVAGDSSSPLASPTSSRKQ